MLKKILVVFLVAICCSFMLGYVLGTRTQPTSESAPTSTQSENGSKQPEKTQVQKTPAAKKAGSLGAPTKAVLLHPDDDPSHKFTYVRTREFADIRADNYGIGHKWKVRILFNKGGKELPLAEMKETINAVLQKMPNLRSTEELRALMLETMVVETGLGRESVEGAIRRYKNYGIAQFRLSTAKEMLGWLKVVRPDVHEQVMSFFDQKHDLTWNISHNVPFAIAMMSQLYWRIVPDIYANISTLRDRGQTWKKYNSHLGAGTVNAYVKRVTAFYEKHGLLAAIN